MTNSQLQERQSHDCSTSCHHHQHEHVHHHHHHHHHDHGANLSGPRLLWVCIVNFFFTLVEFVGGFLSNSLSLISDAAHNLADAGALLIAYVANRISRQKPNASHTFGYKRFEIIAAFFNAVVLVAFCLFLLVEAYTRFLHPEPVQGLLMLIVAVIGLLANVVSVFLLQPAKGHNLNAKAAYLHLLGDTLSSVAVILGGLGMLFWDWYWLDPLITALVGLYIIWHTWGVLRESVEILMQRAPTNISLEDVRAEILRAEGVENVHHIHLWRLADENVHFEAHICLSEDMPLSQAEKVREALEQMLVEQFEINHVTIQLEYGACHDGVSLVNEREG